MPKEVLGEKLYTVEEVAEMIGVTKRTMTTYIQQGRLQGQKLAKRLSLIHISEPTRPY